MRRRSYISAVALLAAMLLVCGLVSGEETSTAPPISCANGLIGSINCLPTKKDLKEAQAAFERGTRLHNHEQLEEAYVQFDNAARLAPKNLDFLTAREVVKSKLVFG